MAWLNSNYYEFDAVHLSALELHLFVKLRYFGDYIYLRGFYNQIYCLKQLKIK